MPTPKGQKAKVKDWDMYEALRKKGKSKQDAARITNSNVKHRHPKKKRERKHA